MRTGEEGQLQPSVHVPILAEPLMQWLWQPFQEFCELETTAVFLDLTLGGGGHTRLFLKRIRELEQARGWQPGRLCVYAVDQDEESLSRARFFFQEDLASHRLHLHHARWSEVPAWWQSLQASASGTTLKILGLLADLGFSSDQVETPARGFSFRRQGPLDMRLDPSRGVPCDQWLEQVSEQELERVLREWGEEHFSGRIAASLIRARSEGLLPRTTQDLVRCVVRAVPPSARHGRLHVATRTFQALRMAVNQEMEELAVLLQSVCSLLEKGGHLALLTFHSIEDRQVKRAFKDHPAWETQAKKPMQPSWQEVTQNPRARSAKARCLKRLF